MKHALPLAPQSRLAPSAKPQAPGRAALFLALARGMAAPAGLLAAGLGAALLSGAALAQAADPVLPDAGAGAVAGGAADEAPGADDPAPADLLPEAPAPDEGQAAAEAALAVDVDFLGGEAEYRALLGPGQRIDYVVRARTGERLHIDLISETGDIGFDVRDGDSLLWQAEQGTVFMTTLAGAGPWTVSLRGLDPAAGAAFRLYLGLDAADPPPPADDSEHLISALEEAPVPVDIAAAEPVQASADPEPAAPGVATVVPGPVIEVDAEPPVVPLLPLPDAPPFAAEGAEPAPAEREAAAEASVDGGPAAVGPGDEAEPAVEGAEPAAEPPGPEPAAPETAQTDPGAVAAGEEPGADADPQIGAEAGPGADPAPAPEPEPAPEPVPESEPGAGSEAAEPAEVIVAGWFVVGPLGGDMLNLRRGPARSEPVVAQAGEGRLLQSSGCEEGDGMRWCRVAAHDDPGVWGWAAAQFLVPAEDPSIGLAAPAR